jgi:hypothetical protein
VRRAHDITVYRCVGGGPARGGGARGPGVAPAHAGHGACRGRGRHLGMCSPSGVVAENLYGYCLPVPQGQGAHEDDGQGERAAGGVHGDPQLKRRVCWVKLRLCSHSMKHTAMCRGGGTNNKTTSPHDHIGPRTVRRAHDITVYRCEGGGPARGGGARGPGVAPGACGPWRMPGQGPPSGHVQPIGRGS